LCTKPDVDTPTLAVCGATALPISVPIEFTVGSSSDSAWNLPNTALVDVLLPESATPKKRGSV
jgi:hypothetical protein